jgi:hypothetical protein
LALSYAEREPCGQKKLGRQSLVGALRPVPLHALVAGHGRHVTSLVAPVMLLYVPLAHGNSSAATVPAGQ